MTYPARTYPHGALRYAALDADRFNRLLDSSQKVAVYWPTGADTLTLIGYYSTVGAANAAAAAAVNAVGAYPKVEINWGHSDITKVSVGPVAHPDAGTALPSWIDAAPGDIA